MSPQVFLEMLVRELAGLLRRLMSSLVPHLDLNYILIVAQWSGVGPLEVGSLFFNFVISRYFFWSGRFSSVDDVQAFIAPRLP